MEKEQNMQRIQLGTHLKRLLALGLALALIMSALPVFSYADEGAGEAPHKGEHKVIFEAKVGGEVKTFAVQVKHKETVEKYCTHDQITKELGVHEVDFKNWLNKKDGSTFNWNRPVTKDMTIIFEPEHTFMKKGLMVLIHTENAFEPVSDIIYVMNSDGYEFVNLFVDEKRVDISDSDRESFYNYILSLFPHIRKINDIAPSVLEKELNSVLEKDNPFFKTVEKELIDLGYNKEDYSHVFIDSVLGIYAGFEGDPDPDLSPYKLNIYLKPNRFKVSFDTDGAGELNPQVLEHRSYVAKVAEPVKENHKFLGWYDGDTKWDFDYRDKDGEDTDQFRVLKEMTLKARWEAIDNTTPADEPKDKKEIEEEKDDKKDDKKEEKKDDKKDEKQPENREQNKAENKEQNPGENKGKDNSGSQDGPQNVIERIQSFDEAVYPVYEDWKIEDDIIPLGGRDREYLTYIHGYEDKSLRAENDLTREEAAAAIFRLIDPNFRELIRTSENDLGDVSEDRWSNKHISSLVKGKIFTGDEDGRFRPEEKLTRAELAVLFVKLYRLGLAEESNFTDTKGHWAEKYIAATAKAGSLRGYGNGLFKPDESITRAEFVAVMNRILNRNANKAEILQGVKEFKDLSKDAWYYEDMVTATNSYTAERNMDNSQKWTKLLQIYVEF